MGPCGRRRLMVVGCGAITALGSGRARAQSGLWPEPVLPGLKRVDAGVADVGPLSSSQRLIAVDLRVPTGFEGVFQFERRGLFGKTETMYMRSSGGISAVFPRSVYVEASGGLVPEIPAGTVFVIGSPVSGMRVPVKKSSSPMAVDMAVPSGGDRPVLRPDAPRARPSMWNDERVRRQRVGELMDSLVTPPK